MIIVINYKIDIFDEDLIVSDRFLVEVKFIYVKKVFIVIVFLFKKGMF